MTTNPRDSEPTDGPVTGAMGESVTPPGSYPEGAAAVGSHDQTKRLDSPSSDPVRVGPYGPGATDVSPTANDPASVRAREKEAYGGIKFGSAFFGWLSSVGATVLLIAIGTAVATAINADNSLSTRDLRNAGIITAIVLLVILFLAYFIGGYVAGRMARFNGARQGFAVWLWLVIFAIILTIIGVVIGDNVDLTGQANLPDIPMDAGDITARGLIALAVVLVVTLVAAILGGLAGMRFHRRVDRAGFDTSLDAEAD